MVVRSPRGLHMRPWEEFAKLAAGFDARLEVINGATRADGASIISLMALGAAQGAELRIEGEGADAEKAVRQLAEFIENFDEDTDLDDEQQQG